VNPPALFDSSTTCCRRNDQSLHGNDIIEIVPLAITTERNQAVIILDEGQNTTISQMKVFLTAWATAPRSW
jgi:phosphate starvation-inducible protein PhoH